MLNEKVIVSGHLRLFSLFSAKKYLEWENIILEGKSYHVVRITPKQGEMPLFQPLMLLITNRKIETGEDAKNVYHAYILRFKIEIVFKFLKQNLGWGTFQIRDFEAIKNLFTLVFFWLDISKNLKTNYKA